MSHLKVRPAEPVPGPVRITTDFNIIPLAEGQVRLCRDFVNIQIEIPAMARINRKAFFREVA